MRRQLAVLALSLGLAGVLSGCAVYRTYEKCGVSGCPGDPQITSAVKTLLDQDAAMRAPNLIYVQTLDRVVYLSGQVATDLQRASAESTALQVPGVRHVVDTIALEFGGR